jgi:hypothetical protein
LLIIVELIFEYKSLTPMHHSPHSLHNPLHNENLHLHDGCNDHNYSSPRRISTKPSATPQPEQFADNPLYAMVVMITTIRPPDRFRPNQAEAAFPMVCERRPCTRKVHCHATGRAICKSCQLPRCAESAKKHVDDCVGLAPMKGSLVVCRK